MDKKIFEINSAVEIAKKVHSQGDLLKASEIYKNLINQRSNGKPVAYLTKKKDF